MRRTRLDNGLTVLLHENHAAPVVAFQAWVGVGSADETSDEAGIAHVFEHMLFKGTEKRGVGQIANDVEAAGGDINAWTSFDQTVYHLVLASRYFDTGLDILADAVQHSSFDPVELERELKVVLEEIKQGEDSPSRTVTQALFSTAFTRHPYRRPVIGFERTVKRLRREKLLEFFHRWYVPNNITLVVVGDFDSAEALRKIKKAWGAARPREIVRGDRTEPAQRSARVVMMGKDVRETQITAAFHVPGVRHEDTPAMDLAAIILGQGDSSRLNLAVKRGAQLATEVYSYSYTPRDPGLWVVGATLPGDHPDKAFRAILEQAFRMAREEVTDDELAKARTILESDAVYQKETVQGMARKLGYFETVAGGVEFEEQYYRLVQAATPAKIRETVARYVDTSNLTIAGLVPDAGAKEPRRASDVLEKRLVGIARDTERAANKRRAPVIKNGVVDDVVRAVLPNGTRILVKRDSSVPIVAFRAVWIGGQRYEDAETLGINNLIAALVTRGTETRSGDEIVKEVESMAGAIGGFSGRNSFGVRAEMLSRSWERGFEILTDCILRPTFPPDEVEKERRQVLDEIHAQEDNLTSVTFRLFAETLYKKHPYRFDIMGTPHTVAAFTPERLREYHRDHFPVGEMTLAVVGDVDPQRFIDRATPVFGSIPVPRRTPPTVVREDLWARPRGTVTVEKFLSRQQAHMVVGFPGTTIDDPNRYSLEVLSTVLSGQGGRLFVELRDKQSLAYRVNAFSLEGIDPGYFAVYIACSPEKLGQAHDGIRTELARIVNERISPAELDRAKKYLVGTHDISLQRRAALASTLAFHEAYGIGWDEYKRYSAGVLAVDAAAVQRVAREFLDWDRAVIATVKPEELGQPKAKVTRSNGARPPVRPKAKASSKTVAARARRR